MFFKAVLMGLVPMFVFVVVVTRTYIVEGISTESDRHVEFPGNKRSEKTSNSSVFILSFDHFCQSTGNKILVNLPPFGLIGIPPATLSSI